MEVDLKGLIRKLEQLPSVVSGFKEVTHEGEEMIITSGAILSEEQREAILEHMGSQAVTIRDAQPSLAVGRSVDIDPEELNNG